MISRDQNRKKMVSRDLLTKIVLALKVTASERTSLNGLLHSCRVSNYLLIPLASTGENLTSSG